MKRMCYKHLAPNGAFCVLPLDGLLVSNHHLSGTSAIQFQNQIAIKSFAVSGKLISPSPPDPEVGSPVDK
jgi:hypothetical protein